MCFHSTLVSLPNFMRTLALIMKVGVDHNTWDAAECIHAHGLSVKAKLMHSKNGERSQQSAEHTAKRLCVLILAPGIQGGTPWGQCSNLCKSTQLGNGRKRIRIPLAIKIHVSSTMPF